jgi:hypothetical protein
LEPEPRERYNLAEDAKHVGTVQELSDKLWRGWSRWGPLLADPLPEPCYRKVMEDYHDRFHR